MNQFMCLNSFLFISYLILSLFFNKKINEYQNVSDRLKYKNKIVSLYSIKHIILLFVTVLSGLILILVSSQMSKTNMDGLDILIFILFAAFSIPYFIFGSKKMRKIEKKTGYILDGLEANSIINILFPFLLMIYILTIKNTLIRYFNFIVYIFIVVFIIIISLIVWKKLKCKWQLYVLLLNLIIHIALFFFNN